MKTTYFNEGICVSPWTNDGRCWRLRVRRHEGSLEYLHLDGLKRSVLWLKLRISEGSNDLRLMNERIEYPEDEIAFDDAETAWAVIVEIGKAVALLAQSPDPSWHEVPSDLFHVTHVLETVK